MLCITTFVPRPIEILRVHTLTLENLKLRGGGVLWIGWYGCPADKTQFFTPLSRSTRPPCQHISVPQDLLIKPKITKFSNFPPRMPKFGYFTCSHAWKLAKIQFRKPKFGPKNQFWEWAICQKSVQQAPKFAADPLHKLPTIAISELLKTREPFFSFPSLETNWLLMEFV